MSWLSDAKKFFCEGWKSQVQQCIDDSLEDLSGVPSDWRCEEVFMALGHLNLTFNGEVAPGSCPNGAVVERTGVGTYNIISAPVGSNSLDITTIVDVDSRDGLHAHPDNSFSQGIFWVGTGDNGAAPDILVDTPLSIRWFGKRTIVICDTLTTSVAEPPADVGTFEIGAPAGRILISDYFADGNANQGFELQVRNQSNQPTNWQACTPSVPYSSIPNLVSGPWTHGVIDNQDGTYVHCFTGTGQIDGFQSLNPVITGDAPNPVGSGGGQNVGLYIP